MANKQNQKNSTISIAIAVIVIIIALIGGNNIPGLNKYVATATNNILSEKDNENINSENINNLENVKITTGNGCISKIPNDNTLRVYCLDVGQGDSILINNNGKTMLIDASTNDMGNTVVKYLQSLGIKKIDYLVGTHPHEDHIGGLDDVINNFDIGTIYMPKVQTNTKTYEDVLDAIANKNLKVTTPKIGDTFSIGDASCEIMAIGNNKDDYNGCSIVIKMESNGVSYLFTGDANETEEATRKWPKIDILKVGHHGSSTSSSQSFLNQIQPKVALISVGTGNSYGHPTESTLKRLTKIGAKIYRTDEKQTILVSEQK